VRRPAGGRDGDDRKRGWTRTFTARIHYGERKRVLSTAAPGICEWCSFYSAIPKLRVPFVISVSMQMTLLQ
jgi:hypothetical protein